VSFFGWEENLHAVPPGVFKPANDGRSLVLDVDPAMKASLLQREEYLWPKLADAAWAMGAYHAFGRELALDMTQPKVLVDAHKDMRAYFAITPPGGIIPRVHGTDEEITQAVRKAMLRDSLQTATAAMDIKILTTNGKVKLTGSAGNVTQRN